MNEVMLNAISALNLKVNTSLQIQRAILELLANTQLNSSKSKIIRESLKDLMKELDLELDKLR